MATSSVEYTSTILSRDTTFIFRNTIKKHRNNVDTTFHIRSSYYNTTNNNDDKAAHSVEYTPTNLSRNTTTNIKNTINTTSNNVDTTIHFRSSNTTICNSLLYHYPIIYYNTTNHKDDSAANSVEYTSTNLSRNTPTNFKNTINTTSNNVDTTIHFRSSNTTIYSNSLLYHYPIFYYYTTNHNDDMATSSVEYTPTILSRDTTTNIKNTIKTHPNNVDTTIHIRSSYTTIYSNSLPYHYPIFYYYTTNHNDDMATSSVEYTSTILSRDTIINFKNTINTHSNNVNTRTFIHPSNTYTNCLPYPVY